ncbi:hypothetical protein ACTFIU_006945 [Dictyostelium citrinum]
MVGIEERENNRPEEEERGRTTLTKYFGCCNKSNKNNNHGHVYSGYEIEDEMNSSSDQDSSEEGSLKKDEDYTANSAKFRRATTATTPTIASITAPTTPKTVIRNAVHHLILVSPPIIIDKALVCIEELFTNYYSKQPYLPLK